MKCKHIIATFIIALIAVLAISFISIDTAKAETLYSQKEDTTKTLVPYTLMEISGVNTGGHTTVEVLTSGQTITAITNTTENRIMRSRTGNRLVVSPQGNDVYLLLLQNDTTTQATLARADYSGQTPAYAVYAISIEFGSTAERIVAVNALNTNGLFRGLFTQAENEYGQYYSRTQYNTEYIPQYPDVEWRTTYKNPEQEEDYITVQNNYNRITGTLTFTIPAYINKAIRVQIRPTTDLRIWNIADMTLQANIMHYNNTGAIEVYYDDELLSNIGTEYLITDYYTQPQLDTYIDMESINGSYKFVGIAFVIPPSINQQTVTLRLGQGMYMKGYLQAKEDIVNEKLISYREGYSAGLQTAEEGDWVHLMTALWDVPMAYINGLFDVTILGINLKQLFKAIVLIALTAAIIKRFI